MITILPFHRISAPQVLEGGTDISLKPTGKFRVEVRRTDGTIRLPFGDRFIDNVILNNFRNKVMASGGIAKNNYSPYTSVYGTFLTTFYQSNFNAATTSQLYVGTSSTPADATQTALQGTVQAAASYTSVGNSITINSTTGDIVAVVCKQFAAQASNITLNECGLSITSGSQATLVFFNNESYTTTLVNRCVFPSPVVLVAGEVLYLTFAMTIPTLASTAQTVTLASQNGFDVSGQLKLVGTANAMIGAYAYAYGTSQVQDSTTMGSFFPQTQAAPVFALSTVSSFPSFGVAASGLDANAAGSSGWGTYTNNSYQRDYNGIWASAAGPFTDMRSIYLGKGGASGYQLLLDNPMTKAVGSTLNFGLRFSMS